MEGKQNEKENKEEYENCEKYERILKMMRRLYTILGHLKINNLTN